MIVRPHYLDILRTYRDVPLVKILKSEGRALSVETVYNYLEWLEKAFVIYRCSIYDLQGKLILKTQEKFYLADASLKYSIMGFNPKYVVTLDELATGNVNGVKIMHLADFLLCENY